MPDDSYERFRRMCESPIENQLFTAFIGYATENGWGAVVGECIQMNTECVLYLQYETGDYRLDFAIIGKDIKIAVEADGRDFHDRTRNQIEGDKVRDRVLQAAGWYVLHFAGSEIYRKAGACVREIMELAPRKQPRTAATKIRRLLKRAELKKYRAEKDAAFEQYRLRLVARAEALSPEQARAQLQREAKAMVGR